MEVHTYIFLTRKTTPLSASYLTFVIEHGKKKGTKILASQKLRTPNSFIVKLVLNLKV